MSAIFFYTIYTICAVYLTLNFRRDLQMLQQNSYRIERYWRWLKPHIFDGRRLLDIACAFLAMAPLLLDTGMAGIILACVALYKIWEEGKRKSKKPLVFTRRVWRLYIVSAVIALAAVALTAFFTAGHTYGTYSSESITLALEFFIAAFSWVVVIIATILLEPVERSIRNGFVRDAKRILKSMPNLRIIGITGSYGKTSTKHYLHHILSEQFDVLMTPGSYNTPMGVVRTIREHLKPYNEIFICEMGAKQKGDIKEICDIVHPEMGIITAVGPMHLETFKTLENVCATKFELVDDLPSAGLAAINNDFDACATRTVTNTRTLRYGITNTKGCDWTATNIRYTPDGTDFTVNGPQGFTLQLRTRLLGECNISDLLGAIVIAVNLGMNAEKIKYAVAGIEQVEHRLSIKRTPGGVTIIDDAFNSNPSGSKMATDVLSQFKGGKRIIVTPGMIELGTEQYNLNRTFGLHIGRSVDVAIVVGEYNREAITEGVRATDFDSKNLHTVASFTEAQQLLATLLQAGDTVLYENDLPDTFK